MKDFFQALATILIITFCWFVLDPNSLARAIVTFWQTLHSGMHP